MNKENIKAILFDLDGTLFKTEAYQIKAWDEVLKKRGITVSPKDYFKYIGKTALEVEKDLIKDFGLDIQEGELEKEKEELILKWFRGEDLELMPYAREALEFFSNQPDFKLALCTSGSEKEVVCKLKKNNLSDKFDVIITKDDVSRGKPAPDVYLEAMERMGLQGYQCLAIEDTEHGLEAAKRAGAFCFAIPQEFSLGQDFSKADKVLESLKDVVCFFE
ncbi:MAG: HAD family phosphatase [Candidatus Pacebacteria bacterium]|nr:HAD family phosphatase [Candidatus Paceibacterota bacterium]